MCENDKKKKERERRDVVWVFHALMSTGIRNQSTGTSHMLCVCTCACMCTWDHNWHVCSYSEYCISQLRSSCRPTQRRVKTDISPQRQPSPFRKRGKTHFLKEHLFLGVQFHSAVVVLYEMSHLHLRHGLQRLQCLDVHFWQLTQAKSTCTNNYSMCSH